MKSITANTDLDSLRERIGVGPNERLRESSRRQSHLQKFARILSGEWDLQVILNPGIAATRLDEDEDGSNQVYLPTQEFPQPITDLRRREYDLLCQEVLAVHEVGHRLYTDWPSYEKKRKKLEGPKKKAFHLVWNAIEDGAIEKQLREEFVVTNVLAIVNANLSDANSWGQEVIEPSGDVKYVYSFLPAVVEGLLDLGHHDAGRIERLLDSDDTEYTLATKADKELYEEFIPRMRQVIQDAHSEPGAVKRNRIVWEFWQDLEEYLQRAPTDGLDRDVDQMEQQQTGRGSTGKQAGRAKEVADGLGQTAVVVKDPTGEEDGEPDSIGGFIFGNDGDDAEEEEAGGGGEEEVSEGAKPTSTEQAEEVEEEVADEAKEDLRQEAREVEGGEALLDEAEEFIEILESASGASPGANNNELVLPDGSEARLQIWNRAQSLGRDLKRILETTLQHEQRDIKYRRRAVGRFDKKRMMAAARGSPRVFQRTRAGEKKDYSCILVTDRSGSISGNEDEVEISQTAFMWALESLGIDTMSIDFYRGQTRLAKPFGQEVESAKDTLVGGEVGGGTPLGDALFFARRRVERGAGTHPFVIIITDGKAGNMSKYREELTDCGFPVFGLYVLPTVKRGSPQFSKARRDVAPLFDHLRVIGRGESIASGLCGLAHEVVV